MYSKRAGGARHAGGSALHQNVALARGAGNSICGESMRR